MNLSVVDADFFRQRRGREIFLFPAGFDQRAGGLCVFTSAGLGNQTRRGDFEIDGTGLLSLPLIGKIRVGGNTLAEAESMIIEELKPDYLKDPHVSLQVLNYRPFYIIGEVQAPGSYPYVNGMTVLEAVAIAGGFTYRAKESRMKIIRATDSTRQKNTVSPGTVVFPGDVIEIPERFF